MTSPNFFKIYILVVLPARQFGRLVQDFHELLAGNRFLFVQVFGEFMQFHFVVGKNLVRVVVRLFDQVDDFLVDLRRGFIRAGERRVATQIRVVDRFQSGHAEVIRHAQPRDHGAGKLGRLLDIVAASLRHPL